eukprot:15437606-Alexandrium_andersonii.AAC.1
MSTWRGSLWDSSNGGGSSTTCGCARGVVLARVRRNVPVCCSACLPLFTSVRVSLGGSARIPVRSLALCLPAGPSLSLFLPLSLWRPCPNASACVGACVCARVGLPDCQTSVSSFRAFACLTATAVGAPVCLPALVVACMIYGGSTSNVHKAAHDVHMSKRDTPSGVCVWRFCQDGSADVNTCRITPPMISAHAHVQSTNHV